MNLKSITEITEMMKKIKNVNEIEITGWRGKVYLRLSKSPSSSIITPPAYPASIPPQNLAPKIVSIKSREVGRFSFISSSDKRPLKVGDRVKAGQVVGVIHILGISKEVISECDGIVIKVLAKEGEVVDYGKELFIVMGA